MKKIFTFALLLTSLSFSQQNFWEPTNGPTGGSIQALASNYQYVFAGSWTGGVFRSSDNGFTWLAVNTGLTDTHILSIAVGKGDNVYIGNYDGIFRSTNNGNNWYKVNSAIEVRSISMNSNGVLFAGAYLQGGVLRSTDDGENWFPINNGLTNTYVWPVTINSSNQVFVGTSGGVFRSTDNGDNWTLITNGLTSHGIISLFCDFANNIFAGTSYGEIFRSTDKGENWSRANIATPITNWITSFANLGNNFYAGTSTHGVFQSTDSGNNWSEINSGLLDITDFYVQSLTVNPFGYMFAGSTEKVIRHVPQNVQIYRTYLDINNISTQLYNNGIGDIDPNGNSGLVFPKGSGKTACFTSGLLWGGLVQDDPQPRVGGTAYRTGLQPGVIMSNGQADDPSLLKYRIYRVRPDVKPGGPAVDLTEEAFNENVITASVLRAQYEADWIEWPASLGAPYQDINENGVYDYDVDIPGVPGAGQTIWYVTNDLNSSQTGYMYGALPLGIEMQATFWAYNQSNALGNMYFRKYKLINKNASLQTIHNMYVSMWADVDLGDAGDDFVGVDTLLSLQYCYNANPTDIVYNPLPPPAIGFDFFQGPMVTGVAGQDLNKNGVDDAQDFAIFNGKKRGPGFINLPVTAAYYFANGDINIGDPPQGDIQGSTQFYNFFRGRYGISGAPFIDPTTGNVTTFALNGDPQTGSGWLDGFQLPPGDRRQGMASGPFTLASGDTQEVVIAEIVAGADPNFDHLAAIGLLKNYDAAGQLAYDNNFTTPVELTAFTAKINNGIVNLNWNTATETNNRGFEVQRKSSAVGFIPIDFVNGNGTTTKVNKYSWSERLQPGKYSYRLKQLDYNGKFEYSKVVEITVIPNVFSLSQNYPNPFNPSTIIKYSLPSESNVILKFYNSLGQTVREVNEGSRKPGDYEINFNSSGLPSGIYFYSIKAVSGDGRNDFSAVKKMILLK